jgi:hypothetical protein
MKEEIVLEVPYKEKDEVKMLGARWDPQIKKWYIPADQNPKLFARWIMDDQMETAKGDRHKNNTDSRQLR